MGNQPSSKKPPRPVLLPGRRLNLEWCTDEWAEIMIECGECPSTSEARPAEGDASQIAQHLIDAHEYTFEAASAWAMSWFDEHPADDNGNPLFDCPEHGLYSGTCGACEAPDREYERRKDRDL